MDEKPKSRMERENKLTKLREHQQKVKDGFEKYVTDHSAEMSELEEEMKSRREIKAQQKQLREDEAKKLLEQLKKDEARIRMALNALENNNPDIFGWQKRDDLFRSNAFNPRNYTEVQAEIRRLQEENPKNQKLVEAQFQGKVQEQVQELTKAQEDLRKEAKLLQDKLRLCKVMFINDKMGVGALKIKQLPPLQKEIEQPKDGQSKELEQNLKNLFDGWKEVLKSHQEIKEVVAEFKSQLSQLQQNSEFIQELRDQNEILLKAFQSQQGVLAVHDAFKEIIERDKTGTTNSYLGSNQNRFAFRYSSEIERSASAKIAEQARENKRFLQANSKESDVDNLLEANEKLQVKMAFLGTKMKEVLSDEKFMSFVRGHKPESARPSSSRSEIGASPFSRPESARPKSSQSASAAAPSTSSRENKSSPLKAAAKYLSPFFQPPR